MQSNFALRTLRYYGQIQIPGESYRGLTETGSRYYGLSLFSAELRTLSWYKHNNFLALTLDKADTTNFVCNINCSLMFVICQNTLQKIPGMFICAPISLVAVQQTLRFHFSLCLFFPDSLGETKPSPPFPMTA